MAGIPADYVVLGSDVSTANPNGNVFETAANKVFRLRADRAYAAIFGGGVQATTNSNNSEIELRDLTAGSTFHTITMRPRLANVDIHPVRGLHRIQPTQHGNVSLGVRVRNASSAQGTTLKGSALCLVELASAAHWAETDGTIVSTTNDSASKTTQASITVNGGGDSWLIMATAEVRSNTTVLRARADLFDGTSATDDTDGGLGYQSGQWAPWTGQVVQSWSGDRTFSVRFWSSDGTTTVDVRYVRLMAVRLAAHDHDEDRAKTNNGTSSSYTTKATASLTAAAAPHLILAKQAQDCAAAGEHWSRLTAGGAEVYTPGLVSPNGGANDSVMGHLHVDVVGSAGSRSWTLDYRANGSVQANSYEAAITAIELAALTPVPQSRPGWIGL